MSETPNPNIIVVGGLQNSELLQKALAQAQARSDKPEEKIIVAKNNDDPSATPEEGRIIAPGYLAYFEASKCDKPDEAESIVLHDFWENNRVAELKLPVGGEHQVVKKGKWFAALEAAQKAEEAVRASSSSSSTACGIYKSWILHPEKVKGGIKIVWDGDDDSTIDETHVVQFNELQQMMVNGKTYECLESSGPVSEE
jgi:hypothetical protein